MNLHKLPNLQRMAEYTPSGRAYVARTGWRRWAVTKVGRVCMKKRLLAVTGIAATVLAIGGFGGMASADTLPGGAVVAAVTGTVAINNCAATGLPPGGAYQATFSQVQIA